MSAAQDTHSPEPEDHAVYQPIAISVTKRKDQISYLDFFADMLPTLRKIDETEPTSVNTHYVARFDVSIHYSNAMWVFHYLVHLASVNHGSSNNYFGMPTFTAYRCEALSSSQALRVLSHRSNMTISM
jgi:hypothetical protein